ncbi:MAG: hypothetical protein KJZ93_30625, partial [Caldilineaceae bacterium]|nr:hypothetical protein [Caldilineaceae bacterium]
LATCRSIIDLGCGQFFALRHLIVFGQPICHRFGFPSIGGRHGLSQGGEDFREVTTDYFVNEDR